MDYKEFGIKALKSPSKGWIYILPMFDQMDFLNMVENHHYVTDPKKVCK